MPSKSKKKEGRHPKSNKKANAGPHDIDIQVVELSREWESSGQKKALVQQIREKILTQQCISIDNAVCLGLGSLENALLEPLDGWSKNKDTSNPKDELGNQDEFNSTVQNFEPIGGGKERNRRLYQLLVFETVVNCLREKFTISAVRFQDPAFTEGDRRFLEERGHIVLEWTAPTTIASMQVMDPRFVEFLSPSTLCFLPCLDLPVIVQVMHTAKPSLYLGGDLISTTASQILLRHPKVKSLMEEYESHILGYEFENVAAFGGEEKPHNFGFMWKADLENVEVAKKLTERNHRVIEIERKYWEGMDDWKKTSTPKNKEFLERLRQLALEEQDK